MRSSLYFRFLILFVIISACSRNYYEYVLIDDHYFWHNNSSFVKLKNNKCFKVIYSHYEYVYNDSIFFLDTLDPEKIPRPIDSIYHKKSKSKILFNIRKSGNYVFFSDREGNESALSLNKECSTVVNSIPYFGLYQTSYKTLNFISSCLKRDYLGLFTYKGIETVECAINYKIDCHKYIFRFEKSNFVDFPRIELYLELNTFFPVLLVFEEPSNSDNNYRTVKFWNSPHNSPASLDL